MLDSLRQLLDRTAAPERLTEEAREHALRLATGALLVEVARADGQVAVEERESMIAAMESGLGLARGEAEGLVSEAEDRSSRAISLHELTHELDRALAEEEKIRLVELLWRVAFADARKDAHEEHRVRQIAGLLHVRHADFIAAKVRAQKAGDPRAGA
jgi:uncharacterized tellurite resistance protein B-like protein